jgi:hypothetical protein
VENVVGNAVHVMYFLLKWNNYLEQILRGFPLPDTVPLEIFQKMSRAYQKILEAELKQLL